MYGINVCDRGSTCAVLSTPKRICESERENANELPNR